MDQLCNKTLKTNAEIYKIDQLKNNNQGNVRTYEKHKYTITYLIEDTKVYILRVRYAKKEPIRF
ncbi:hypothetical protein ES692_04490 [Psychroserpens burtonensis]|uniref:Type II toxin-antitoxin system RelE/ParE family toxin n=1 Tax=Psychroserpens burtonensis TaxID=49278 RepID=A0A5C7BBV9_9FLAO|nr:hypothetical protein [Psychroserpens burtonensis]TXE19119.1 hypothetical protein ES692_04490 [Psychroserpens burtonensis]